MAFLRATFCGASVRSFSTTIGWDGQTSQMTVQVVEDPTNGDRFVVPEVGSPIFFQFYGFTFSGLLQKWNDSNDTNGKPVYTVICVDPREILDGAEVIISSYPGSTGSVPNLLNAYGYWEDNAGFGGSLENDAGMPWSMISSAVLAMTSTPGGTPYGGPLVYHGVSYSLDLSQVPSPPVFYRMGGVSVNLLQAIAQVCEDGQCSFYVDLVGFTIVVRIVSRLNQPPLGKISEFVAAQQRTGIVEHWEAGLEARNEITSSFLVGGQQTTLNIGNNLIQFWGYDSQGNPITSTPTTITWKDSKKKVVAAVNCESMTLNASPVADVLGKTTYPCTTLEMRLALTNFETWSHYLESYYPNFSQRIGLVSSSIGIPPELGDITANGGVVMKSDLLNDGSQNVQDLAANAVAGDLYSRLLRLYDFVRGYAEDYMGKKFLVGIPFVLQYQDPETLKIVDSYDVTDSGFLSNPDEVLATMSELNRDTFMNPDGRFRAFVRFTNLLTVDFSAVPTNGTVIEMNSRGQPTSLFVEVSVDPNIVFNPTPCALITLPGLITDRATDACGDLSFIATMMNGGTITLGSQTGTTQAAASVTAPAKTLLANEYMAGIGIFPNYRLPIAAAIPLRSNILTYGPWMAGGVPGKVKFDHDPELTPWNYGDEETMNLAGSARVAGAVSNMNMIETATLELAEPPRCSLGGLLSHDGPNVTDISMEMSLSGFKTTYRFATFTQRFGVFSRSYQERLKRMSLTQQSLRRAVRASLRNNILQNAANTAAAATRSFMQRGAKYMRKQSPHEVLVSNSQWDGNTSGVRFTMQTATLEEALGMSNAAPSGNAAYKSTAIMSLTGLMRPFTTNQNSSGDWLPAYQFPTTLYGDIPNLNSLDPFKAQNDVEVYTFGDTYGGLKGFRKRSGFSNARLMALRGPLVIAGWGYGTDGLKYPGDMPGSGSVVGNGGSGGLDWSQGYLNRQDLWPAGPVDLLWDPNRAVWTCHGKIKGVMNGVLAPGASGLFMVRPLGVGVGSGVGPYNVTGWNGYLSPMGASGNWIGFADYIVQDNRWYVTTTDCVSAPAASGS